MSAIPADAPQEAGCALNFRKGIFEKFNPHFQAIYAARNDYFEAMGWAQVPLEIAPLVHSQATVLVDLARNVPFLSCIIGIAPAHSLMMEPHGDCRNLSSISNASFRFALEPPCPHRMPTFHRDYITAIEKLRLLQDTLPSSSESTTPHPFLQASEETLSFCQPLFVHSGDYPLLSAVTSLSVPTTFRGHCIGLAQTFEGDAGSWPLTQRSRYPIDYEYRDAFLKVDKNLVLLQPAVESESMVGSVPIEFANDRMQDALVCVLFHLIAGVDGSLVARFTEVQLLTMLVPW